MKKEIHVDVLMTTEEPTLSTNDNLMYMYRIYDVHCSIFPTHLHHVLSEHRSSQSSLPRAEKMEGEPKRDAMRRLLRRCDCDLDSACDRIKEVVKKRETRKAIRRSCEVETKRKLGNFYGIDSPYMAHSFPFFPSPTASALKSTLM